MIEKATGVVLRLRPLTETSLIVHWLTPGFGRIATVAKGARRPKSPFRGKLDLFYLADFSFTRSRRSELHTLTEVSLRESHRALREEFGYLQQTAYCFALMERTTETETPLPGMFELVRGLLGYLPQQPPQPQTIFAFELKLLAELGQQPDISDHKLSSGTKQLAVALLERDWKMIARLRFSKAQTSELENFLGGFLQFHVERMPGRAAALSA